MPDVEVKINSMYPPGASGGIRAYVSATVDGCLGIRGIKVPFLLAAVFFGGMGGGDIKLMAACGLVLGLLKGLFAAMAGLSLLLIYVLIYRIVCRVQRREAKKAFPLAPFLSAGCLLTYFIS